MLHSSDTQSTILILIASAREDGNTAAAVERLRSNFVPIKTTLIDLAALNLRPFTYDVHDDDGFRDVIRQMIEHRHVVFATPVYWYAMSGWMKMFFDRLTDLLIDPNGRPLGRALAGRETSLLATGSDPEIPLGFTEPFSRTATYFDMRWTQSCYVRSVKGVRPKEDELSRIDKFAAGF